MRVCIDVQAAVAQRAGVGRYTHQLVEHLADTAGRDEAMRLFYFDFHRRGLPFALPPSTECVAPRFPGRVANVLWNRWRWPPFERLAGPADVYHFPNFVIPPLRRGRSVATIHDLSFMRYPEFTEARNLRHLGRWIRDTAARADAIITISHFSGHEVKELLGVPAERIHAIPLAVSPGFCRPPPERIAACRTTLGLDAPYLLAVGTLEPRKHYDFLIELFEAMEAFDGLLVIAGMPGWKFEPILERMRASRRAGRIRYLRYVSDEDLPALYAGAELFVQTSYYEGFGLPPLEAMACGTPVISSAGGSLGEVLGDGAELVDTFELDRWVAAAGRLLEDGALRERLARRGRKRASTYTWTETAHRTWAVYRTIAGLPAARAGSE